MRKLIHVGLAWLPALGWLVGYDLALGLALAFLAASIAVEVGRRRLSWVNRVLWRLLPAVFRGWEGSRVLGSTWFAVGAAAALLLFGRDAGGTAILFLAWGDPAAELAGRWWACRVARRTPGASLPRKTLAGSLGCLAACLVGAGVGVGLGGLPPAAALAGALVATAAERWSPPPDDNVWMPLASGLVMWVI